MNDEYTFLDMLKIYQGYSEVDTDVTFTYEFLSEGKVLIAYRGSDDSELETRVLDEVDQVYVVEHILTRWDEYDAEVDYESILEFIGDEFIDAVFLYGSDNEMDETVWEDLDDIDELAEELQI
jgi:hypothetical protein